MGCKLQTYNRMNGIIKINFSEQMITRSKFRLCNFKSNTYMEVRCGF
jgi:hypothetical protein